MISDILLINSNHMNAGSSIYSLGIIRVSQLRDGQNWTRYFETLAHETGHQFLNAIWTLDPLIENEGDNLFTSPLRKEPRPLSGIFHAALVLARTIRSIHSLQSHISYDPHNDQINSSYNNKQNPSGFHDKFIDCCTVLDKHAIFSSQGQHIYDEIKEFVGGIYNV